MYTNIFRSDVMRQTLLLQTRTEAKTRVSMTSQFDAHLFNSVAVSLTDVVYAAQQLGHALNRDAE